VSGAVKKTGGKRRVGTGEPGPGRPKGLLNKTTLALRERIEREGNPIDFLLSVMKGERQPYRAGGDDAEAFHEPTLEQRLSAARTLAAKVCPDAKDRPIRVEFGALESPADALRAISRVLSAMGAGEITPAEASSVVSAIDSFRAVWEATELERRIAALEKDASEMPAARRFG
jgi:hypothetical protein